MIAGKWFVQVHPLGGRAAETPVYFQDFAATLAFVKAFKELPSGNILRAHVPTNTSYQQRQQLIANGATPVWHAD